MRIDAIVIGAGPAGSSCAIVLAKAGWSVVLIEKSRFPRRKVCGECIAASNFALLAALGLGPWFDRIAGPELRQIALMDRDDVIVADLPQAADTMHRWGRALGREQLDTELLSRARELGVVVLQPWRARSARATTRGVQCEAIAMDTHERVKLEAPVLIDAHGSWEVGPGAQAPARAPNLPGDLFAFKANFADSALASGLLPVLALPGGYGGMVIADHGVATLACCIRRDALAACRALRPHESAASAVERWLKAHCRGVREALGERECSEPWLAVGPIRPGIRIDAHAESTAGVFVVGNAAGEAHPIIGEGISMAIQSAWLLCERLLEHARPPDTPIARARIQADYAHAWQRSFAARIRWSALFAQLAMHPRLAHGLLPVLRRWPALMTDAARRSGKVRCAIDPARIESRRELRDASAPRF